MKLTFPPLPTASNGRYVHIKHFDAKGDIEKHIRTQIPNLPSSFFLPGFYASNFANPFFGPTMFPYDASTKSYSFTLPIPPATAGIPIFDAEADTGKFVKAILVKRDQTLGKRIYGAAKYISPNELAEGFEKVRGVKAKAVFVETADWKKNVFEPAREEMAENMEMMGTTGYYGGDSLDWSLSVSFFLLIFE